MTTNSIRTDPILNALFTSQARVEILKLLFVTSSRRHYLREIASLTDQPLRAVQRELNRLEAGGLVESSREGNRKYFQVNRESPVFAELRSLLLKTTGLGQVLAEELADRREHIQVAFIFGSFAAGAERPESDIDLFVIGDISSRELATVLSSAKETLGREFNPITMTSGEFRRKSWEGDAFLNRLLDEPMIFLIGGEYELGEIAGAGTSSPT